VITKAPITRVIVIGTKQAPRCDPNYSGACVPIASDVDCAGGSGNGPAYVQGPVRVVGTDVYGLDADGDGIGCDS
jgi:resuscitation-promoting factor RpfB